jgi:hypothetical protein
MALPSCNYTDTKSLVNLVGNNFFNDYKKIVDKYKNISGHAEIKNMGGCDYYIKLSPSDIEKRKDKEKTKGRKVECENIGKNMKIFENSARTKYFQDKLFKTIKKFNNPVDLTITNASEIKCDLEKLIKELQVKI